MNIYIIYVIYCWGLKRSVCQYVLGKREKEHVHLYLSICIHKVSGFSIYMCTLICTCHMSTHAMCGTNDYD